MAKLVNERGNSFFRLLDRYVGIPLILFFSIFNRKKVFREKPDQLRNIAFIKLGAIGDSILTIPFIEHLKDSYDDLEITVICGNNNHVVYANLLEQNVIDNIIRIEFSRLIYDWGYVLRKIKECRACSYRICFDFDSWYRISALVSFCIKADYTFGFEKEHQFKHYLFDHKVAHQNNCHEFVNYEHLMEPVAGNTGQWPNYPVASADAGFFENFMSGDESTRYIVFHPWASGYKHRRKELDKSAMMYLGNELASSGLKVIITGSKADAENAGSLAGLIENARSIAGKTTLNETAVFLKNAQCVVTVNTGILHLAAAVNSNIVSINGPTDINRWGPLSKNAVNIKSSLFCSPCLDLGFEYKCKKNGVPAGHCMSKIDLDNVIEAALQFTGSSKKIEQLN